MKITAKHKLKKLHFVKNVLPKLQEHKDVKCLIDYIKRYSPVECTIRSIDYYKKFKENEQLLIIFEDLNYYFVIGYDTHVIGDNILYINVCETSNHKSFFEMEWDLDVDENFEDIKVFTSINSAKVLSKMNDKEKEIYNRLLEIFS